MKSSRRWLLFRRAVYNKGMMEVKRGNSGVVKGGEERGKPNLLAELKRDYPNLRWRPGRKFMFRGPRTVVYEPEKGEKRAAQGEKKLELVSSGVGENRAKNQDMNKKVEQVEQQPGELEQKSETTRENEQKIWRMRLLHEVGHALLGHRDFTTDVERLKMERAAWEKAEELYRIYREKIGRKTREEWGWSEFDQEVVEAEMDSYRDWLHQRSRCPECGLTRYQTLDQKYHCPQCEQFL